MNKLAVGQTVYLKSIEYRAGHSSTVTETVVTKTGKKYFEVADVRGRFFIETLLHDAGNYTSRYQIYLSLQEIEDERERSSLHADISRHFSAFGNSALSLDQLRRIHEIIQEKE